MNTVRSRKERSVSALLFSQVCAFSEDGRLDADIIVDYYTEVILRSVGAACMAAGSEA
jgi:hypothetical protein